MKHTYCYRIKELCIKLFIEIILYYDARSTKTSDQGKIFVLFNFICPYFKYFSLQSVSRDLRVIYPQNATKGL